MNIPASIIRVVYNAVLLPLAGTAFFLGKLFHPKLAARVHGVHRSWSTIENLGPKSDPRLWFHASSMGEFEQAKPVIEHLKALRPDLRIVVSFFSPSGYEHQKHYAHADAVVYMPLDTAGNARRFIDLLQPDAAVFVRYDVWHNHLAELRKRTIPATLICATVNTESLMLSSALLQFTRRAYGMFSTIYTAGESETRKILDYGLLADSCTLITAVDTRVDRIATQVEAARERPVLPPGLFAPGDIVLVAGSTWEEDENILLQAYERVDASLRPRLRLVLVPHEPGEDAVARLLALLPDTMKLSEIERLLSEGRQPEFRHAVVDSIGKLLRLYGHAHCAYVGGGFGAGVHSVTEPAGYGIPLACGPGITRARDAVALRELGALCVISSVDDAVEWLTATAGSASIRERRGGIARKYVYAGVGYSETIARALLASLPAPNRPS